MNGKKVVIGIIGTSLRMILMAVIILCVYRMSMTAYNFGFRIFAESSVSLGEGREVDVTIPMGKSTMEIGEILEEKGLIRDAKLFYFQEKLSAYRGKLRPGFYTLNTSMTAVEMMEVMAKEPEENTEAEGETQ